ncbi:uncharacterized protein RHIMIDRAFT_262621 [Rhizopus microsporus ATCC 52813]|uniref:Uncharacterized protein n=1 Tax=Rhizopus microsporus ATCC 52813 TaxID=1340429 RepID=A0A2G4SM42_RHIZD|nr:uncharacterized protein RHIMIDRAFT_262621 [Rhizopus microsporus ATCC 52813]PHZ09829.1 hypothetical protein RHIMIDRAFT_262621 [Rhizopus microsporus ATCC 52813]
MKIRKKASANEFPQLNERTISKNPSLLLFLGSFIDHKKGGKQKRKRVKERKTVVIIIDYFCFICGLIDISLIAAGARVDNERKKEIDMNCF